MLRKFTRLPKISQFFFIFQDLPISTNQTSADYKEGVVEHLVEYISPTDTTHYAEQFGEGDARMVRFSLVLTLDLLGSRACLVA